MSRPGTPRNPPDTLATSVPGSGSNQAPGTPERHAEQIIALGLLGFRVHLHVRAPTGPDVTEQIARVWERCLTDEAAHPDARIDVVLDPDGSAPSSDQPNQVRAASESELLDALASRLTLEALQARVGELLLLHAASVADPDSGATVVLVAPSGTGKTTAAIALGRHFGYLSDEVAAINLDGTLLPFPKPLSLLVDGRRPKAQVAPDDLGLLPAPAHTRLKAMLLLDRSPEPTAPKLQTLSTVQALPALAAQASSLHLLPKPLHLLAGLLRATGGLRRVTYHEAEDLVPVVAELMRSPE